MQCIPPEQVHPAVSRVSVIVFPAENDSLIGRSRENIRGIPADRQILQRKEAFSGIIQCHAVFSVPIAGNDNLSVGKCQGRSIRPSAVHDADRMKTVRLRIIDFRTPTLTDSERFSASPAQKDTPVRQHRKASTVMRPGHLQGIPGAVPEGLGRPHRIEPVGMASEYRYFIACHQHEMPGPRRFHIGQPLETDPFIGYIFGGCT